MRILVVDDDPTSRLLLRAAVEKLGHVCTDAASAASAWQILTQKETDVLVTDWMMPDVEGPELVRRIRADPTIPYVYVTLMTSLTEPRHLLQAMRAGADDYLTKPLEPLQLEARLIAAQRVTTLHRELDDARNSLLQSAMTDALTGVWNRRRLEEDVPRIHALAVRRGRPYSIALCDIDHFKDYNDALGHQEGDGVLKAVASTAAASLRISDSIYRYGGEEFLVVLVDEGPGALATVGERLRSRIEAMGVAHPTAPTGVVTMSIGMASLDVGRDDAEDLIRRADAALYRAKAEGRNRVVVASSSDKTLEPSRLDP